MISDDQSLPGSESLTDQRIAEMKRIFQLQREVTYGNPFPSAAERRSHLQALAKLLSEHRDAIAEAISADFGHRPPHETRLLEIFPALESVKFALAHLEKWMRPARAPVPLHFQFGRAKIIKQPLGVVGIIVPWNYPIHLSAVPLVSVLAAGNRAIIKMSEFTPRTASLFSQLAKDVFAEEQVVVLEGGISESQALASLPLDHLVFTGSTSVGHHIMRAAAENLTPVTLELGGKSPAIIAPGFPIDVAADRILWGKCLNAGQTCIAPDYVLLPHEEVPAFIEAARKVVQRHYPEGAASADYCSIINVRHYDRLMEYLREAQIDGAKVIPLAAAALESTRKFPPTLVLDVNERMRLMQDEIFGPLLPIIPYTRLEEALAFVARRPRPLALYYFDDNKGRVQDVLKQTMAGGVTVNDTILHIAQDSLPFGGVGASGMGEYHGEAGFNRFSKRKGVFLQSAVNALAFLKPPYGKLTDAILKKMMR